MDDPVGPTGGAAHGSADGALALLTSVCCFFPPLPGSPKKKGKMIGYPSVFERPKTSLSEYIVVLCYIDVEYKWLKFQQETVYQDSGSLLDL